MEIKLINNEKTNFEELYFYECYQRQENNFINYKINSQFINLKDNNYYLNLVNKDYKVELTKFVSDKENSHSIIVKETLLMSLKDLLQYFNYQEMLNTYNYFSLEIDKSFNVFIRAFKTLQEYKEVLLYELQQSKQKRQRQRGNNEI